MILLSAIHFARKWVESANIIFITHRTARTDTTTQSHPSECTRRCVVQNGIHKPHTQTHTHTCIPSPNGEAGQQTKRIWQFNLLYSRGTEYRAAGWVPKVNYIEILLTQELIRSGRIGVRE